MAGALRSLVSEAPHLWQCFSRCSRSTGRGPRRFFFPLMGRGVWPTSNLRRAFTPAGAICDFYGVLSAKFGTEYLFERLTHLLFKPARYLVGVLRGAL